MQTDETTKSGQDNSTAAPGESSGKKGGGTSKDKGKLYTAADITKVISDAKAEAGRLQKAAEVERDSLKGELQTTNTRLGNLERDVNESRLAEARGDPDQLRAFQREQATTQRERAADDRERDVGRREAQLKTDQEELDTDKGIVSVAYVAAKHGLKTEDLESLGISDQATLDKVAEKIAAGKPPATKTGEEGEEEEGGLGPTEPDSGDGGGTGAEALTTESVEKMSIASVEKAIEKAEPKS